MQGPESWLTNPAGPVQWLGPGYSERLAPPDTKGVLSSPCTAFERQRVTVVEGLHVALCFPVVLCGGRSHTLISLYLWIFRDTWGNKGPGIWKPLWLALYEAKVMVAVKTSTSNLRLFILFHKKKKTFYHLALISFFIWFLPCICSGSLSFHFSSYFHYLIFFSLFSHLCFLNFCNQGSHLSLEVLENTACTVCTSKNGALEFLSVISLMFSLSFCCCVSPLMLKTSLHRLQWALL